MVRLARAILLVLGLLVLIAGAAAAQDFGQNKVQYKDHKWLVIETAHFRVYFYEGERAAAVDAARMAERAYTRLSTILRHQMEDKVPLVLYASHTDFAASNVTPSIISEGTGGMTELLKRRVMLPFTGGYGDLDHVLTHELVHAFQVDILFSKGRSLSNPFGAYTPPGWFMEGMAEYLSTTKVDNLTQMWLRDGALQGYLIPVEVLGLVGDIRVYRFGQSIFAYIGATFGDDRIGELLRRTAHTRSVDRAFQDVLGMTLEKFSRDWMEEVRKTYLPQIRDHKKPDEVARTLTDSETSLSSYHLAPAVSPGGDRMVFLSDRSLHDDLYLASALDGKVERRLVKGDRAEEFESLRFINASFDFAPDGESIVFAAKLGGGDAIYRLRLEDGKVMKRMIFPLDGIANPSFSPDGEEIVFVGLHGGRSDLFRCRADGSEFTQLTDDRLMNFSPRYSPDGRSIVFVTDEGPQTDFQNLIFEEPRLAILDLESGATRVLPGMQGTNTAPYFFPDGRHLLYVSDRTGISNLYIRDLETDRDAQITDLLAGVSGIIPLSPAVSLSRDGRRLVFSAFSAGSWDLFAIKDPLNLAKFDLLASGEDVAETVAGGERPDVPPAAAGVSSDSLAGEGGAAAPSQERAPREPPLSIAAVELPDFPDSSRVQTGTPPAVVDTTSIHPAPAPAPPIPWAQSPDAVAASLRKDMPAGRDSLATWTPPPEIPQEPAQSLTEVFANHRSLPDTTGFTIDRYRIKFSADYASANGAFASNVGFAAQTYVQFSDVLGNHNLVVGADIYGSISDSQILLQYVNLAHRINYGVAVFQYRDDFFLSNARAGDEIHSQIYRGSELTLSRPFSRFRRLDFSLEALQLSETIYRQAFLDPTDYTYRQAEQDDLYFLRPGLALVNDNTIYGITGPIGGGRGSIAADVSIGDLQNTRLVLDRRSYWNFRQRYAFAMRLVGGTSNGKDPVVFTIGGPLTLRGYDYGTISGKNVGIVNLEFRFPFIEALQLGWPLPLGMRGIRGALFFDAASAWYDTGQFRAFNRVNGAVQLQDIHAAYGFGVLWNVGFAILRWDLAWPTNLHRNVGHPRGIFSIGSSF
jgi:Tol biopolymer transport system component